MSRHNIKKGTNPKPVFVATINEDTTNIWLINRKFLRTETCLINLQPTQLPFTKSLSLPFRNPKLLNLSLIMSLPSNLVPNLNEIMEEYIEGEHEAVQATQVEVEREDIRAEERAKLE